MRSEIFTGARLTGSLQSRDIEGERVYVAREKSGNQSATSGCFARATG
ncbi:MAG: hypothetical protein J2P13_10510 [Acidobacteria bacterium]|nr:hypothetical protein [Acidobacteriota bacterium]